MPVTNILTGETQTPTPGLQHAAGSLETTGNTVGETAVAARAALTAGVAAIQASVFSYMDKNYGAAKGPVVNAKSEFSTYFQKAVDCGYDFSNAAIISSFAQFLLAVATEGFTGADTTGTQMGNFQGKWPGGGFH
jgi:hypothetical protein